MNGTGQKMGGPRTGIKDELVCDLNFGVGWKLEI